MIRRRTQRTTRSPEQRPAVLALGLGAVALALLVLVVAARSGGGLPGEQYYRLRVQFSETGGATVLPAPGADVREAGVRIGQTRGARLERGVATLDLQLDGDVDRLPVDSRFIVRAQGLLGAKYVEIVPGRSTATLATGSVVAPTATSASVSLSELLQSLDAEPRADLRRLARGLGGGLAGRGGALNGGLEDLAPALEQFRRGVTPTLDAGTLPQLIAAADSFITAVDPVRVELGALFAPAARALQPFFDARADLARLLDDGAGDLAGTEQALAQTDPLLRRAQRFSRAATRFTAVAPRGLQATAGLLRGSRRPLRSVPAVLTTARAAVAPTLRLTAALNPILPQVRAVAQTSRQPTRVLGTYGCDISRFARNWRSFLGYAPGGQTGPLGPLTVLRVTLASPGVPGAPVLTPGAGVDGDIMPCEPVEDPK